MFLITKEFIFDAAHYLPRYRGKCETLHGHTYKMHVTVSNKELEDGLAFDFVELKNIVKKEIIDHWDHQLLNDHLENPSTEHMCMAAWDILAQKHFLGEKLFEIKIWETPTSFATYRGKNGKF